MRYYVQLHNVMHSRILVKSVLSVRYFLYRVYSNSLDCKLFDIFMLCSQRMISAHKRLDGFALSVGNSSDRNQLIQCGNHTGTVAASASVVTSCEAVGRYLQFRRVSGTTQPNIAGLCEVVIIGHLYISK